MADEVLSLAYWHITQGRSTYQHNVFHPSTHIIVVASTEFAMHCSNDSRFTVTTHCRLWTFPLDFDKFCVSIAHIFQLFES